MGRIEMNKFLIVLGLGGLLSFSFLGLQTYRIANSLEYGEVQARKFQPIIDTTVAKLEVFRRIFEDQRQPEENQE
jgi:hypothetical protein